MTAPQDEWTEWFHHDGKGCPCVGKYVHVEYRNKIDPNRWIGTINDIISECEAQFIALGSGSWFWVTGYNPIIRYRIRKPRALLELIQLIADLPAPVAPIKTDGVIA